jgi:putative transposase
MKQNTVASVQPLIAGIHRLFSRDLALENDFLRAENRVLRELIPDKRPKLTDRHRRLLIKYGMQIKDRLRDIISIVKPETLLAWNRRMKTKKWDYNRRKRQIGRPPKGGVAEDIVVRLAEENAWGYVRIAGELKKLGHDASPSCVRDILRKHGLSPAPNRKGMSWKTFIQAHLDVAWAADFFTEEVWTRAGLTTFYVLFFIHLKTRRILIAGATANPDAPWTQQQARNVSMSLQEASGKARFLIHDRDASFQPLDSILKTDGIKIVKTPPGAPQCNAFAERLVREARETLDNLILLGQGHLQHVLKRIETHHNENRPHQGIENNIPVGYTYPDEPAPLSRINCDSSLGGLLNHYYADKVA